MFVLCVCVCVVCIKCGNYHNAIRVCLSFPRPPSGYIQAVLENLFELDSRLPAEVRRGLKYCLDITSRVVLEFREVGRSLLLLQGLGVFKAITARVEQLRHAEK